MLSLSIKQLTRRYVGRVQAGSLCAGRLWGERLRDPRRVSQRDMETVRRRRSSRANGLCRQVAFVVATSEALPTFLHHKLVPWGGLRDQRQETLRRALPCRHHHRHNPQILKLKTRYVGDFLKIYKLIYILFFLKEEHSLFNSLSLSLCNAKYININLNILSIHRCWGKTPLSGG